MICTDKTGTLTLGEMRVSAVLVGDCELELSERGVQDGGEPVAVESVPGLVGLATAAVLCNNARLGLEATGDPTERALLYFAQTLAIDTLALGSVWRRVHEIPFDSERKRMMTVSQGPIGLVAHIKGAPDMVLPLCTRWLTRICVWPLAGVRSRAASGTPGSTGRAWAPNAGPGLPRSAARDS